MQYESAYPPSELYHYGRKGMKWGQHIFGRRNSGSSSSKSGSKKKKQSSSVRNRVSDKVRAGKDFVKRNRKVIAKTALRVGLASVGLGYIATMAHETINELNMEKSHRGYARKQNALSDIHKGIFGTDAGMGVIPPRPEDE